MIAKLLFATAACCIALATPVSRVTETTLPLADERASAFYFVGDIALAVDYEGGGKVTGRINAYDVSKPAFAWRQEVRVQETDKNPGSWIMTQASRNRLLMGNGPLTALDLQTGRVLWALDCKTAGSVLLRRSSFYTDGDLLLRGSKDCGDLEKQRILRVDGTTGAIRWQVDAEVHSYKTGNIEHRDFAVLEEGVPNAGALVGSSEAADSALLNMLLHAATLPPTQLVVAGKRLSAIDYQTGRQNWAVKDEPGRWVPATPRGLSLWVDDEKMVAYSTRDGSRQWVYNLQAPWPMVIPFDTTATSDLLVVTWKNAHRIDRSGRAKWTVNRDDPTWGQLITPTFFALTLKKKNYAAIDLATGQIRWRTGIESERSARQIDEELSPVKTGVVLIRGYDDSDSGPWEFTALDAASGRVLWSLDRLNKKKVEAYWVVDETRLVIRNEDGAVAEVDVKTGTTAAGYTRPLRRRAKVSEGYVDGYRLWYSVSKKTMQCDGPDGVMIWQRKGELSENATFSWRDGVVVWPTQDGKVELIDLRTGASLHTTTGNKKPFVGVDLDRGRILVPYGKTLKVLTIASSS